jgi:arylsulfatase A-like enzyme/Tfp pilus assembly protein PilF
MKKILIALALPLLLAACSRSGGGGGAVDVPKGTPVIVISVDTLRADHLPAYGYKGVATPAIDALREEGILYERAYAVTPLTLPSHTTLLTGVLPAAHGVRDNVGYKLDPAKVEKGEVPYLPEILKKAGYATGGAISAYVLQGKTGLSTSFDFYEDAVEFRTDTGLGGLQRAGGETLNLSRDWLRSVKDKPFFFFFHIYEPHTPYSPPAEFDIYPHKYDGDIAAADKIVGDLIQELKDQGIYDEALVVLLSDHGEGLGDHGEEEHGVFLYNEAIHVPLIVKLPDGQRAGSTVARPVELADVAPTVLSLMGLDVPKAMPGLSLLADNAPARRIYSETFYPRLHFGWSELFSLIDENHHYIEGPDPELYDRAKDPGERTNVLRQERRAYASLRGELGGFDKSLAAPSAVDEETRQAMASLGYIGGSGATEADGPLPDPKSKIGSLADLKKGFQLLGGGSYPEAAAAFQRVIDENPKMVDAWEYLARAYRRMGQTSEALEAYRQALKISNGSPQIAVSAASLFYDLGRLEDAETHAKMALVTHPSFAHGLLAQIALQRKNFDAAEKEAQAAMADASSRVGPLITLAEVRYARKDGPGALDLLRQAEEAYNQRETKDLDLIRGLYLVRGKVLADQGDAPGAERSFLREIEIHKDAIHAYSNLAILYALTGRAPEVRETLKRMVDTNPTPAAYAEAVKTLRILNDTGSAAALLRYAMGRFPGDPMLQGLARG